jgi:hypothetical protein
MACCCVSGVRPRAGHDWGDEVAGACMAGCSIALHKRNRGAPQPRKKPGASTDPKRRGIWSAPSHSDSRAGCQTQFFGGGVLTFPLRPRFCLRHSAEPKQRPCQPRGRIISMRGLHAHMGCGSGSHECQMGQVISKLSVPDRWIVALLPNVNVERNVLGDKDLCKAV